MKYFFTSDTEFNHTNIIKYCNRPFKDIPHMNETIVNNWNSVVSPKDLVFHLGDVGRNCDNIVKRLNGIIFFVRGNHDLTSTAPWLHEVYIPGLVDEYGNKRLIVLCHYAMRSWNKSHYASWHLFGHHHSKLPPYGLSFDVGMDCNNFFPFTLEQVSKKMETLKPIVDFRMKNEGS
jgi:calcineurin-like phosphoesterase family protein